MEDATRSWLARCPSVLNQQGVVDPLTTARRSDTLAIKIKMFLKESNRAENESDSR
jgi:hypothetical protein